MSSFMARRREPQLVAPARATPRETKPLSDLDDHWDLRILQPSLEFFRPAHRRPPPANPADAIRAALAEALVYYYPMAGRLRELPKEKLAVECTGEGVVFVEATADVRMRDLGEPPMPPFRRAEEFLCDVGDAGVVIGKPLVFMQVTLLKCGAFVIGTQICHCMADAFGTYQFLKAIVDLACGQAKPAMSPIWERELFMARTAAAARINPEFQKAFDELESYSCECDDDDDTMVKVPVEDMVREYFVFSERDMAELRRHHVPANNLARNVTSFELLTALTWRSRTSALGYGARRTVRLMINVNARGRWSSKLRDGYYGNALFCPIVETTAGELCARPLEHAIDLVRKAKQQMITEEKMQSRLDLMPLLREKGSSFRPQRMFEACDVKWTGQTELDFGWAKRIGGGIPSVCLPADDMPSCHFMCRNEMGDKFIVVSMLLPRPEMDIFREEMAACLNN
ncbi:hypothetical protein GUJ93_ZPchr0012g20453 [Zizania palustris]|uniref:Uncharacterized protein n=1 Tax=Zizania palustris TaxID=103762 RepID=A0A8J5WKE6_ZIZPA|nr:hypothetical protein GUJ93_ZPchr0012g20453 [Zizania palustris]